MTTTSLTRHPARRPLSPSRRPSRVVLVPRHTVAALAFIAVMSCLVVAGAASRGPAYGAVAIAVVAGGLAILRSPALAGLTLVAVVPVTSGIARGLPVPGLRLSEILVASLAGFIFLTADRRRSVPWRAFDWLAVAYVVATAGLGLLNTVLRSDTLTADSFGTLVGPLQFVLLYRAVLVALPTSHDRRRALDLILLASIPVSILTMLEAANAPGIRDLLFVLTGQDYSDRLTWTFLRAAGPFSHWTMLSGYMMAILLLCTAVLLNMRDRRARRLALVAMGPAAASLVLTVTLAPMIGTVVGVFMLAAWSQRLMRTAAFATVAIVTVGLAFSPLLAQRAEEQFGVGATAPRSEPQSLLPSTIGDRVEIWTEQYLPVVGRNYLTGYGPQVPDEVDWKYSENVYLTMLLRGGLPLLAIYFALQWAAALIGRRGHDARAGADRTLARTLYALVLLMAVIQFIVPYFVTTGLPHLWWALVALAVGTATSRDGAGLPGPGARRAPGADRVPTLAAR